MRRRWSRTSRLRAGAALVFAALAGASAHAYLSSAARAARGGPPVAVVVATTPIARGVTLDASELRLERIPARFAPPNPVGSISRAAGRVALASLAAGEAVTETRLARVRAGPVASLTPEGLRAFAVPVSLPPGEVAAGDRVDVLATYTTGAPHTETVVAAAQVLLVLPSSADGTGLGVPGGGISPGSTGSGTALVLLVSPDDEERLAYATAFARLSVAVVPL